MAHDLQDSATDTTKAREMSEETKAELRAMAARVREIASVEPREYGITLGAVALHLEHTAGASLAAVLDKAFPKA